MPGTHITQPTTSRSRPPAVHKQLASGLHVRAGDNKRKSNSELLPIKTRRRCIMHLLDLLTTGRQLTMPEMQRVLGRSIYQVRRILTTMRKVYDVRIKCIKGCYHVDSAYTAEELNVVAYKILRGNDRSAKECFAIMNNRIELMKNKGE